MGVWEPGRIGEFGGETSVLSVLKAPCLALLKKLSVLYGVETTHAVHISKDENPLTKVCSQEYLSDMWAVW